MKRNRKFRERISREVEGTGSFCVPSHSAWYNLCVYRPVLPGIVCMCTVQLTLAGIDVGQVLEINRT